MKTILLLLLTILCLPLRAGFVVIEWDEPEIAVLDRYAVWVRPVGETEWTWHLSPIATTTRVEGLAAGQWECQVTTVYEGYHSEPSNTIILSIPEVGPGPPVNLQQKKLAAIESSEDLQTWAPVVYVDLPADAPRAFYRLAFFSP